MGVIATYLARSLFSAFADRLPFLAYGGYALLSILIGSILWLFFVYFRSGPDEPLRFEQPLRTLAFQSMGILSFLFTFTLLRDLLTVPAEATLGDSSPGRAYSGGLILILSSLSLAYGNLKARTRLLTPVVSIPAPHPSLVGLRIVQLSDMHLGGGPSLEQIRRIVDRALSLEPDLLVLTGDIIDGDPKTLGAELRELSRLRARLGVYFVSGNHECYWNHDPCVEAVRSAGITPLLNEGRLIPVGEKPLFLAGVLDPAMKHFKGTGPVLPPVPAEASIRILLAHQPGISTEAEKAGYELQLSGHTHGGQFFPWTLFVGRIHRHSGGLSREGKLRVYVNRGSGFWGPPIRLGTDGEITQIRFQEQTPA
jgi:predicted MPP superfamily phosphohydrolase